jgi:hypothetical protein
MFQQDEHLGLRHLAPKVVFLGPDIPPVEFYGGEVLVGHGAVAAGEPGSPDSLCGRSTTSAAMPHTPGVGPGHAAVVNEKL